MSENVRIVRIDWIPPPEKTGSYVNRKVYEAMADRDDLMTPATWQAHLRDFVIECDASGPGEQAARLREAWCLCLRAPQPNPDLPSEARLEELLDAAAYESAALALLGPGTGYLISRGGNGAALASVVTPDAEDDQTASGATPALALLAAFALALLGEAQESAQRASAPRQMAVGRLN